MGSKYVIFDDGSGTERAVIFDGNLQHKDVADKIGWRPVSAGTLFVTSGGLMACAGGSITLDIFDSRPEDVTIVRKMLTGQGKEEQDEGNVASDCGDGVADGMRLAFPGSET